MSHSLIINGWSMYAHPLFLGQQDELIRDVERLPNDWDSLVAEAKGL
ncbi:hypothetical protein FLM9_306 [Candidatus Synechococcus spongiarum]|uniref:Toxin n=1 Tax=Candidatus Synechococcus spongiarum TaxID=431041 RepID=A0A170T5D2_9SYNE|nr:hypothetical protein FLM9_306 [Candidatus Synechococcus spongiarum]